MVKWKHFLVFSLLHTSLGHSVIASTTILFPVCGQEPFPAGDSLNKDSAKTRLHFPFNDKGYDAGSSPSSGGLYLDNPSNVKSKVDYDPSNRTYNFTETVGDSMPYRRPTYMTLNEYRDYDSKRAVRQYWREKFSSDQQLTAPRGFRPKIQIESETFDRIFGGTTIDIRPQGSAELIFGVNISKNENPAIPEKQRQISTFDFNEKIQFSMIGNIGDKMKLVANYNTQATFDFENQMKLAYTGNEDEIIQLIEAGNVTLPLKGSLITGSQTLFGLKTGLKFGRLNVTSVVSQQRGKKSEVEVQGGAQVQNFEIKADRYEANRHFFLAHFFRDQYESSLATPPVLLSEINITKIEVWITNTNIDPNNTRNIIAFQDLGEGDTSRFYNRTSPFVKDSNNTGIIAHNNANTLYKNMFDRPDVRKFSTSTTALDALGLAARKDYQRIELGKKLSDDQYTINRQLGYISLNQELNASHVLAVAFEYTYQGQRYQVGEFSATDGTAGQDALFLKMLKSTQIDTKAPMWNLMMKNVYSINAWQVKKEKFQLEVMYLDRSSGILLNYFPESNLKGVQLLKVMELDKINTAGVGTPDGVFDFIDNPQITIAPKNGRVYFPVLEPFGSHIRKKISDPALADKFAFDSLYATTQANAQVRFPEKNRFVLKGKYQSSVSSEISLNAMNVPQGSVTVTAGGVKLTENVDYTVDYTLGRVKIINEGIMQSGTPIKIAMESNQLFNIQSRTLFASRFDYTVNKDFALGGTVMNMTERPITQKINIGDEPMSNTIWGVDGTYRTESRFLTTLVDKIPFIDTKEKSTIGVTGEFAQLVPGHSRAIGTKGTSYIDDFEGSQSAIDLRSFTTWTLASTPQGQSDLFPEAELTNRQAYGFNRARIAWHVIDPLFFRNNNLTPKHILNNPEMQSNHYMREVWEQEVFPTRQLPQGQPPNIPVFDLAFYPSERGPYNYDANGFDGTGKYGYGLNPDGTLKMPEKRWGGIMRRIETTDFDAYNVEFIQFWVLDPFSEDNEFRDSTKGGDLYFNIGYISEDVLKDGVKFFENGLPVNEAGASNLSGDTISKWGKLPYGQSTTNAFDNNPATRPFQDVGLDGLRNEEERKFDPIKTYLEKAKPILTPGAYTALEADPSADDYNYYRDDRYDQQTVNILDRYKKYNGLEGNSPSTEQSSKLNADGYPTSASTMPNVEDVNRDNTLEDVESYFQYKVKITPKDIQPNNIGNNFITDAIPAQVPTKDGRTRTVYWYQFKVPIRNPQKSVGGITDFRTMRFFRMFMSGFDKPVVLRFARLELIRGEWRKYLNPLEESGDALETEDKTRLNIAAVNIEENSSRKPVNYTLPPGIQREINIATPNLQQLNEQALAFDVCELTDGKSVAAYKSVDFDIRSYNRLQMYVHAENGSCCKSQLNNGDVSVFVRLGTDNDENYYEYEVPLKITPPGYYNPGDESAQYQVWPLENNIDIELGLLQTAKSRRNSELINKTPDVALDKPYKYRIDATHFINVKGNPNLNTLKAIMIGVRNPKKKPGDSNDDGLTKCVILWFNEMRLTDFNEKTGWAAIGRVNMKLADFANVALAGSMSTPYFGSVEKKVSERQRETIQTVDASTSMELGQFLPANTGIKIPTYIGFSETQSKPQFAPQSPDLEMQYYTDAFPTDSAQKEVRDLAKSLTRRRSLNFTNVRKERSPGKTKQHFYDVENLSATYAYIEIYQRDFNTRYNTNRLYRGGISYNYSLTPKNISPLSKVGFLRSKYLTLIRDFNFSLTPRQLSFRTDVNRNYTEREMRNNQVDFTNANLATAEIPIVPFYDKSFTWMRTYDLKYDLTRGLKFDFNANANSLITEPIGRVDKRYEEEYKIWRDSVLNSVKQLGLVTNYKHTSNLTYTVPINKIPMFDWVSATAQYSANYEWTRAPLAVEKVGNTIQNSRQEQINLSGNLSGLYNKSGYLKKVMQKFNKQQSAPKKKEDKNNRNKLPDIPSDTTRTKKKKKEKDPDVITITDHIARIIMSFKNASVTYSQNEGILMPGYAQGTQFIGMDKAFNAPGYGFIFGQQGDFGDQQQNFGPYSAGKGWLVREKSVNTPHTRTYSDNLQLRGSIDPTTDFRIELTANRQYAQNHSEFFRFDSLEQNWKSQSPLDAGNFSISYSGWKTAFIKDNADDNSSPNFQQFLENRRVISDRLGTANPNSKGSHLEQGYKEGYGSTSPNVLIPAFLSAYSGKKPEDVELNPFVKIPDINWRVTYTGLSRVELLKPLVKNVTLSHSYRSSYTLSSFTSNLRFDTDKNNGYVNVRDDIRHNFIPQYEITSISISEQFAPLINVDITWAMGLQTRSEFKRDRTLTLALANTQVTEIQGNEMVFGMGYTFKNLRLPVKFASGKVIKSDLRLSSNVSVRDSKTVIRKAVEGINQLTAGQRVITINFTADYALSERLNLRLFFDKVINEPKVSLAFRTANTNAGISLRFTLAG